MILYQRFSTGTEKHESFSKLKCFYEITLTSGIRTKQCSGF